MHTRKRLFPALLASALFILTFPLQSVAQNVPELEQLVQNAQVTFENFRLDQNMSWLRNNIKNAKGIFIVPGLLKAGFIWGGSGGSGVLLAQDEKTGEWSYPAFYTMGSVSFGFQAGVEKAEVILMIMTQNGIDAMLSPTFKLGAGASIAAGPVGIGAEVKTVDIIAFARAKGLFGGISIEGAVISSRNTWNSAYYGKQVRPVDILIRRDVSNENADWLREMVRQNTRPQTDEGLP